MALNQLATVFLDNLPTSIRKVWVYNLFTKFGKIWEVFIPNKKSKITNQHFGFVRFYNNMDASLAIKHIHGHWFWGQKLVVQMAKFGTVNQKQKQQQKLVYRVKYPNTEQKDVIKSNNGISETHIFRGAGKSNIQYNTQKITIQPTGNGWLHRSAIAKIRQLLSPNELEKVFEKEGISIEKIKAVGERYVIIIFPNSKLRDEAIGDNWTQLWFEEIKPWMGEADNEERFAWLSCYGMPLNGWSVPNFRFIGNSWGKFIQVDESTLREVSYEKGRVLIVTEQVQKIMGSIKLDILGKIYTVRIEEDESFRIIKDNLFTHGNLDVQTKDREKNDDSDDDDEVDRNCDGKTNEVEHNAVLGEDVTNNNVVSSLKSSEKIIEDSKEVNAEINDGMENGTVFDNLNVVEVVDETPAIGNTMEVVENDHNDGKLQLITYKQALRALKDIQQPEFSSGSAKVASISSCSLPKFSPPVEVNVEDQNSSWNIMPFNRKQDGASKKLASEKFKRKQKSIEELIGIPKSKKGGKKKKNSVILRASIVVAALSISSDGIKNRNRIILDEEEAAWTVSKLIGEDYMGNDEEVISKFMVSDAANDEVAQ